MTVTIEQSTELSAALTSASSEMAHVTTKPPTDNQDTLLYYFYLAVVLLGFVGLVGNAIVLWLLSTKNLRKRITTTLLVNQSVVDLVSSLVLVATYVYAMLPPQSYETVGHAVGCMLFDARLLVFCTLNSSTFCLVLITIERYLMIAFPIKHRAWMCKKKLVVMAIVAWAWGIFGNAAITIPFVWTEDGRCFLFIWPSQMLQDIFAVIYYVCVFFSPICFFIFAYSHMLLILYKRKRKIHPPNPNDGPQKMTPAQLNLTKTCLLVTLAFLLCWTPNQTYFLLFQLGYNLQYGGVAWMVTQYLCFVNSCINPFIYAFKHTGIRAAFKAKISTANQVDTMRTGSMRTGSDRSPSFRTASDRAGPANASNEVVRLAARPSVDAKGSREKSVVS